MTLSGLVVPIPGPDGALGTYRSFATRSCSCCSCHATQQCRLLLLPAAACCCLLCMLCMLLAAGAVAPAMLLDAVSMLPATPGRHFDPSGPEVPILGPSRSAQDLSDHHDPLLLLLLLLLLMSCYSIMSTAASGTTERGTACKRYLNKQGFSIFKKHMV